MLTPSADGRRRCFGSDSGHELYAHYHDTEWGVPVRDDRLLFETLILEGAQAGLSWETVLKKRDGYRALFHDLEPVRVAAMEDQELETALLDQRVIRHRQKILSVRTNARVFLEMQQESGRFADWLWAFVDGTPVVNHWKHYAEVPASTPTSIAVSKELKRRGMKFVGPTIVYAWMQGVGLVDDHLADCWVRTNRS